MNASSPALPARLGVRVADRGLLPGLAVEDLVEVALRQNPKRPHLLVSTVLGKHVPTDPRVVRAAGLILGVRVAHHLRGADALPTAVEPAAELAAELGRVLRGHAGPAGPAGLAGRAEALVAEPGTAGPEGLVLGYAETATALGHLVGRALGWPSIHSTRRRVPGFATALTFDETHSHATEHLVLAADPDLLRRPGPVVLVDDELSTGRTALRTIRELHAVAPRDRYVVAALVDVRHPHDRDAMAAVAEELGTRIDVVALASGEVSVPDGVAEITASLQARPPAPVRAPRAAPALPACRSWPWRVSETGRHGFRPADEAPLAAAAELVAADLAPRLGDDVLVLGTEELMYAPLAVATALGTALGAAVGTNLAGSGRSVLFSTTTRSPVRVLDEDGYPIRTGIAFPAHDQQSEEGVRFAYNLGGRSWSDIVLVVDSPAATGELDELLAALGAHSARVHPVVLPAAAGLPEGLHGPGFGSYAADEVTWLLKDLSGVQLEADREVRERAIQRGDAHYAESLPVEYQPERTYQQLFEDQLPEAAARVATAVGAVTELARAVRDRDDLVLVSLARAGTPIGILMRRWAAHRWGRELPHYAVSIVRDRGIDLTAMRYLAARHDPRQVLFVDGWTGKGAITREFTEAVAQVNAELRLGDRGFDPRLAVLADPGECVSLYGTREDFLIPSACLNSTVSGLVSRTVLNDRLIGPADFHGAKFYAELAAQDVSGLFLDAVTDCFDRVAAEAERTAKELAGADRSPTWVGWAAAERVRATYGIPHVNLVKPGVGETTRVLLRRVPWKVVANPARRADLRHVEMLAAEREVEIVDVDGLPYSCIGLIRPEEGDGS